ncbi:MAG: hypothetical protein A2Y97_00850 [Nitrospirae bacterium RBG_13_39_12]|nr:MAG: hypothetical protein A2Y97_00850 [Nitrospirae bacterium RBG_13_39_12]
MSFTKNKIQNIYGTPFVEGNNVKLLWKDKELFHNILDYVNKARELICLEFYIFRNDETGNELAEILKQKASEGVKVYILYDHFGSFGTSTNFWKDLKQSGIQIRASHPLKWTSPFQYVHRDHKKLIIIDGISAFTGGLNIANEYRGYHRSMKKAGWRDTGIFLEGPIAKTLLDTFIKSWEIWGGITFYSNMEVKPETGGLPVLPIFASTAKGRRNMRKILYYSINQSQKSIYLTTAYFTPSRRMIQVLENAVARGVDVKLLLPGRSDVPAAYYAGRASYTKLLKAGIDIYNYQGEILHAKTAVFDEMWSVIGSANLDFQSLRINDEGNVGIIDKTFGKQMIKVFNEDLEKAEKINLDKWLKRPFLEKARENFFAIFRRRL